MIEKCPPNQRIQPTASLAALASRRLMREPLCRHSVTALNTVHKE
jgi:hypothetical protein